MRPYVGEIRSFLPLFLTHLRNSLLNDRYTDVLQELYNLIIISYITHTSTSHAFYSSKVLLKYADFYPTSDIFIRCEVRHI